MRREPLDRLAEAYGLELSYTSETRETRLASDGSKRAVLRAMGIAAEDDAAVARSLAAAPKHLDSGIAAPPGMRCFLPGWLETGRAWGVTCQLYGLRSARNHGIGDFEDLAALAEGVAPSGADFIGINPVHALFTADPQRCSPFSPSNRRFLNPLYIAIDRIPGISTAGRIDDAATAGVRSTPEVDYRGVAALKLGVLRGLWTAIAEGEAPWEPPARAAFEAFVDAGRKALRSHCLFEALSHAMVAAGHGPGWSDWPAEYRRPDGAAARRFAAEREDEVRFHMWLQWIADVQLEAAAARARAAGMRIGLYLDFAVGTAPDGSATWSDPALVVPGANIGAPPDAFFTLGQDWGLAPMSPAVLRERDLEPYRDMLRIAMRHAGAIRIDHAMSLQRLFWIPHGMAPAEGCYVRYPKAEMLRALAEVSAALRTIVVGEDLGTVPAGFRELMEGMNVLSYRVLYFERSRGGFRSTVSYRRNAFVTAATHDLPPLAAWWTGKDIALYRTLGLLDNKAAVRRRRERSADRHLLITRLRTDVRRARINQALMADPGSDGRNLTQHIAVAAHAFLARTRSRLLGLQYADLCGSEVPVNIPGTWKEYPNWRLRMPVAIEDAPKGALWSAIVAAVTRERPRSS